MLTLTAHVWGQAPIESGPGASNTEGRREQAIAATLPADADDGKAFATMQAKAAIAGHLLQRHGTIYLISRWGYMRDFDSLSAVGRWLERVGGS